MVSNAFHQQRVALLSSAVFALAACGGGGGDSGSAPLPPRPAPVAAPATASGIVLLPTQAPGAPALAAATVCYDTNKNSACDAGEPTTAADGDGAYTLSGLPAVQPADVAIVAHIPAGSAPAYTVQTPVSRPALISTLTTMVQFGVSQGLTLAASEAAVARQFQVEAADLYGNYRTFTGTQRTWFNTLGLFISQALQTGIPLRVGPAAGRTAGYEVTSFTYINATTRYLNYTYSAHLPDATTGLIAYHPLAQSFIGGQAANPTAAGVWSLAPGGPWMPNYSQAYTQWMTAGNPYVSINTGGGLSIVIAQDVDVSGQTLGDVVAQINRSGATANSFGTVSLPASIPLSSLTSTLPAGSRYRVVRSAFMASPANYREADRLNINTATLAGMLSGYPTLDAASVPTESNSVLLRRNASVDLVFGSIGCMPTFTFDSAGNTLCPDSDLRVTFDVAASTASFHVCDYRFHVAPGPVNCRSAGTAGIAQGLMDDGTTPSLSFTNLPPLATGPLGGRVLVQHNGGVFKATPSSRPTSPSITVTSRLNRAAFTALASALGVQAPDPTITSPSPYMGAWRATYSGAGSGTCRVVLIDALGDLVGACTPPASPDFILAGTVSPTGATAAVATGINTGFTGQFTTTSASGTWLYPGTGDTGTWSATKY